MIVSGSQGRTYAEVLGQLRTDVRLGRATGFYGSAMGLTGPAFAKQVGDTIEGMGEARMKEKRVTLKIRDVDTLAKQREMEAALRSPLADPDEGRRIKLLGPSKRKLRLAVVILGEANAVGLQDLGHLWFGFVSARVRR